MHWVGIALVGLAVGFLAGLFGKGGSAIATPLLHALGVPAIVAVAAPLPATIPSTVVASAAYWRQRLLDWQVVTWSVGVGVPATITGAVATRWIAGSVLVSVTDVVIAGLGLRFLLFPGHPVDPRDRRPYFRLRLVAVAAVTGLASGLLGNSGGFLLAPLYVAVLRLPLKQAFACSLAVAAVLAVPGTIVHAALGHIDWSVVAVFGRSPSRSPTSGHAPACGPTPFDSSASMAQPSFSSGSRSYSSAADAPFGLSCCGSGDAALRRGRRPRHLDTALSRRLGRQHRLLSYSPSSSGTIASPSASAPSAWPGSALASWPSSVRPAAVTLRSPRWCASSFSPNPSSFGPLPGLRVRQ